VEYALVLNQKVELGVHPQKVQITQRARSSCIDRKASRSSPVLRCTIIADSSLNLLIDTAPCSATIYSMRPESFSKGMSDRSSEPKTPKTRQLQAKARDTCATQSLWRSRSMVLERARPAGPLRSCSPQWSAASVNSLVIRNLRNLEKSAPIISARIITQ